MGVASARVRPGFAPNLIVSGLWRRSGPGAVGILVGAVAWELIGRAWNQPFFPPLSGVIRRLGELTAEGVIVENLANSLLNLAIGFTFSAVVGITVGALMGVYRKVGMGLEAYIFALLTAPSLVFAPVFFAVFGVDEKRLTILGIIVLYSLFIVIVNTAAAIRAVPIPLVEMGRSYNGSDWQLFRKIILPASLPLVFAGLRLSMGRAVKGMINGEMLISFVGLGGQVDRAGQRFDAEAVLAVLLVIVITAMVMVKLVQIVDLRMTSWLPSNARARKRT